MKQIYKKQFENLFEIVSATDPVAGEKLQPLVHLWDNWLNKDGDEELLLDLKWALSLAEILVIEFRLGLHSALSAFLWRPVSKDLIGLDDIKSDFGRTVALIVKGLVRLESMDMSKTEIHSENFIQLLLSMSTDVRVILIKTAERLIAIREVEKSNPEIAHRVAIESRDLFAPIAHRLGLYLIKSEFEERAMKQLDEKAYRSIARKLNETKKSRETYIQRFIAPIEDKLDERGFRCDIKGRPKSIHSIYNKMQHQGVEFNEVYDLFAIRIVLDSLGEQEKSDCWQVYSIVTDQYQPNPNRLRDWISTPKANGYESLHTTVIGPDGKWVEVQVRTRRMDEIAEHGHAAHWKYKEDKDEDRKDHWLDGLRDALNAPELKAEDDSSSAKKELYSKQIYVFTPLGDLIKLSRKATVLDFAFAVHTNVGYHCTGGKVNGRIVPIKHNLVNGDQVEILTSAQQKPKTDWLNWVNTSKAKTRIKRVLKEANYRDSDEGKDTLKRKFEQWKIKYDVTTIHRLVNELNLKHALDLYQQVADNKVDLNQIKELLKTKDPAEYHKTKPETDKSIDSFVKSTVQQEDYLIIDEKLDQVDYRMAKCCNPIYGDEVFGFIKVSEGTKIHRINCPNAAQMLKRYPYRVVKVHWTDRHGNEASFPVNIRITGIDDIGIVNEISKVISSDLRVNMRAMNISSNDGIFIGQITLVVQDKQHLATIIDKVERVKGVISVLRSDE